MVQRREQQATQSCTGDALAGVKGDAADLLVIRLLEQAIRILESCTTFENQLDAIVEWKDAANVAGVRVAKPDRVPTGIRVLGRAG